MQSYTWNVPQIAPQPPGCDRHISTSWRLPAVSTGAAINGGRETKEPKFKRCKITREQLLGLIQSFDEEPFPTFERRQTLSRKLGMLPRSVQIWFQNRRQRLLKPRGDGKEAADSEMAGADGEIAGDGGDGDQEQASSRDAGAAATPRKMSAGSSGGATNLTPAQRPIGISLMPNAFPVFVPVPVPAPVPAQAQAQAPVPTPAPAPASPTAQVINPMDAGGISTSMTRESVSPPLVITDRKLLANFRMHQAESDAPPSLVRSQSSASTVLRSPSGGNSRFSSSGKPEKLTGLVSRLGGLLMGNGDPGSDLACGTLPHAIATLPKAVAAGHISPEAASLLLVLLYEQK